MTNAVQHETGGMPVLTQVPTSITLSAEQFEKLYLNPMLHRQSATAKNLGNPTPLYVYHIPFDCLHNITVLIIQCRGLGAFVLTATPLSCCLMGWRGAGGAGAAFT